MNIINLMIAFVVAIIIGFMLLPLFKKSQPKGVKIVEDAKKSGRAVQARLIKKTYIKPDGSDEIARNREGRFWVLYEYTINNKTYHYKITLSASGSIPETLTLYYPKNHPESAISSIAAPSKAGASYMFMVLLPVIIWAITYNILNAIL